MQTDGQREEHDEPNELFCEYVNAPETVLPYVGLYRGADKSLARPGRKQATATQDFEFHIFYL